jgi:hypothetical protein
MREMVHLAPLKLGTLAHIDARSDRIGLEYAGQLVSVYPRHHHIEQHEVGRLFGDRNQCLFAAVCAERQIPFRTRQRFQQFAIAQFIVDDEDGRGGTAHGVWPAATGAMPGVPFFSRPSIAAYKSL